MFTFYFHGSRIQVWPSWVSYVYVCVHTVSCVRLFLQPREL